MVRRRGSGRAGRSRVRRIAAVPLAALLAGAAVLAGTPGGAAAADPLGAARPAQLAGATEAPRDVSLYRVSTGGDLLLGGGLAVAGAFPTLPSAATNAELVTDPMACDTFTQWVFYAVVGGALTRQTAQSRQDTQTCATTTSLSTWRGSAGWGSMRQLVRADTLVPGGGERLYGLHTDGRLYRYTLTAGAAGAPVVRGAGSAPGFGAVRSIALVRSDARVDVLVANLSGGSLYALVVPTASPMRVTVSALRTRSWSGFEQLMTQPAGLGSTYLSGLDRDTGLTWSYRMGARRGTATTLTTLGQVPGTTSEPVVQGGTYDGTRYEG